MNIKITSKDLKATDAIKEYIEKKCERLQKYTEDEIEIKATIKTEGKNQVAEISTNINGNVYRAVTEKSDLYASVDKDIDILEGQIRKSKTKKDRQNMTDTIRFQAAQSANDDVEIDGEIIKTIYYSIKPLTAEDAKLILEGDPKNKFLPFINVETNKVNVIYKLKDGKNFGILEPEA